MTRSRVRLSRERRGTLQIISGTAAGQLIVLGFAPLLSRLYTPADFGILATCSAIAITAGTVAALRYELAIPLPQDDSTARRIALLGLLASFATGVLGLLVVQFFGYGIARSLGQPALMPWLWIVPLASSAMGCYLVFNQLSIRQGQFGLIGRRNLLQQLSIVAVQTGCGIGGMGASGLVIGLTAGQLASVITLFPGSRGLSLGNAADKSLASWRLLCRRYRSFPLLLGPAGLLNVLGVQLPVLLVAHWYGGTAAGHLGLTQRVLTLPVSLIGVAVGQVYLSQLALAERSGTGDPRRLFFRASRTLAGAGLLFLAMLLVLGPWAFQVVFGSAWSTSGHYARAMSLALVGQLIAAPLSQTLIAKERQGLQLLCDATRVVVVAVAVFAANGAGASALQAVWVASGALALTYGVSWLLSVRSLRPSALPAGVPAGRRALVLAAPHSNDGQGRP